MSDEHKDCLVGRQFAFPKEIAKTAPQPEKAFRDPIWYEQGTVCGQCEYGKLLNDKLRMAAGGLGAPPLLDCWNRPPSPLVVSTSNGTGLQLIFPRLPTMHPACGQFKYSKLNEERTRAHEADLKERTKGTTGRPFGLILPT